MPKYLRLNIENAGLLSNIEIIKNKNKPDTIKYDYVFKTIDNPIPKHLLLNMLTDLIGEIPIPKYKKYGYTNDLVEMVDGEEVDKQTGRKILQKIISEAYVYYHINGMNLFNFLDKESIDKPWVAYNIEENDGIIRFRGTTEDDVRKQIHDINEDENKYVIKEKKPWGDAPWEFIMGEKYQINSDTRHKMDIFHTDTFSMTDVRGIYNWWIFEKNFNLNEFDKNIFDMIIKHIQKILKITEHPKQKYKTFCELCEALYKVISSDTTVANDTLQFCIECDKITYRKTLNCRIYLYVLFGYNKDSEKLYSKKNNSPNISQPNCKRIRHTAVVETSQLQAMFSFDGSIIIPLDNPILTNEEKDYIIQRIDNNSRFTNCLEGGIARIEKLDEIQFNMVDYIQIFKPNNMVTL